MTDLNTSNNKPRILVEWSYKKVKQMFKSVDFKWSLKIKKPPVVLVYLISCLMWNVKVCLHGGAQLGCYFDYKPPSLEEYLTTV